MIKLSLIIGLFVVGVVSFGGVSRAQAQNTNQPVNNVVPAPQPLLNFEDKQPIKGDFAALVARIINVMISVIAAVAIVFIIIGGFRLAFSQGNTEAVTAGKKTITWAIIGLIIALMAFVIVRIVRGLL